MVIVRDVTVRVKMFDSIMYLLLLLLLSSSSSLPSYFSLLSFSWEMFTYPAI
jgi:hypothetical protein